MADNLSPSSPPPPCHQPFAHPILYLPVDVYNSADILAVLYLPVDVYNSADILAVIYLSLIHI